MQCRRESCCQRMCMMNWLSNPMLLIQKASGLVTKTQYDLDKQGLEKKS